MKKRIHAFSIFLSATFCMAFLFFFFTSADSYGQSWVEEGHNIVFHHVKQGSITTRTGCEQYVYVNDTVVNDRNYQVLKGQYDWYEELPGFGIISSGILDLPDILLTTSGDTTWFLKDDVQYILANFSAQAGDQWSMPLVDPTFTTPLPPVSIVVDSIGITTISGDERRVMHYTYGFEFANGCTESGIGFCIEGLYHHLQNFSENILPVLPDIDCALDQSDLYQFSEFSSAVSELFLVGTANGECSFITVGLSEQIGADFLMFPNPAHDGVELKFVNSYGDFDVDIFNLSGKLVLNVRNSGKIDISGVSQGTYILRVSNVNGLLSSRRIVVL